MPEISFKELQRLLADHQSGMSDFQDDYFVTVKAGGTIYGQYKQSLRELYKRFRGLRELIYGEGGRKMLDISIRELELKVRQAENDAHVDSFEEERLNVRLQHKYLLREESERAIRDTYREFMRFYQQAEALKQKVGNLSPETRRKHETDMWIYRAKEMAAMDFINSGQQRLSSKTIEFIRVLPRHVRDNVIKYLTTGGNRQIVIDDYLGSQFPYTLDFENMELPCVSSESIEETLFLGEGQTDAE